MALDSGNCYFYVARLHSLYQSTVVTVLLVDDLLRAGTLKIPPRLNRDPINRIGVCGGYKETTMRLERNRCEDCGEAFDKPCLSGYGKCIGCFEKDARRKTEEVAVKLLSQVFPNGLEVHSWNG